MNHLIFGCGYLGRRVADHCLSQGRSVGAMTRRQSMAESFRQHGIVPFLGDVLSADTLAALPRADTVIYAIGLDRSSGASMRSVYVDGLANVLTHLPLPKRFIYISSSSVYGQDDGSWVDENSPTEPQEESGQIVLAAERLLLSRLPDAIILRFAGIYGPARLLRQKAIEAGEAIIGDGGRWLNLIHVDDGAQAVLAAERLGRPGRVYNVCDDEPVRRFDFYANLARALDAPPPRFVAPPTGQPLPPHERGNRRIQNQRMHEELQLTLAFPTYLAGLKQAVGRLATMD